MKVVKIKTKTKPQNKVVVYTGRRLVGNKVQQRFEHANGSEMFFTGVHRVWLGYFYKAGTNSILSKPDRVEKPPVSNAEWEAQEAIVAEHNAKCLAEAKMSKFQHPHLDAAILALKPLCRGLDYFDRHALITFLTAQTGKKK